MIRIPQNWFLQYNSDLDHAKLISTVKQWFMRSHIPIPLSWFLLYIVTVIPIPLSWFLQHSSDPNPAELISTVKQWYRSRRTDFFSICISDLDPSKLISTVKQWSGSHKTDFFRITVIPIPLSWLLQCNNDPDPEKKMSTV